MQNRYFDLNDFCYKTISNNAEFIFMKKKKSEKEITLLGEKRKPFMNDPSTHTRVCV